MYILFSLFISIYDIKTGMVSRFLLWGALLFFFIVKCFLSGGFFEAATGGALGILVFLVVFFISRKRLGLADVWYAGLAGIVLGPLWWYPAMALSCLFGILVTVVFRRRVIPFIPCMAAGSGVILSYTFWSK
ncbi:MAG: prepilin peptidase [Treponema sp.]|nr:prepilin peptidase [Treponema sp.]